VRGVQRLGPVEMSRSMNLHCRCPQTSESNRITESLAALIEFVESPVVVGVAIRVVLSLSVAVRVDIANAAS
jgi:hypothetical protein